MKHARGRTNVLDYAIVGAGAAGLYVAGTLAQRRPTRTVHVFDAARGPGGRVASLAVPGTPFIAEIGAMRFLPHHVRLMRLIQELGLPYRPFGFNSTAFFYLRGRCVPESTFGEDFSWSGRTALPYRVEDNEHRPPMRLILRAIRRILARITFDELPAARRSGPAAGLVKRLRRLADESQELSATTLSEADWELIKEHGRVDGEYLYESGFWDLVHRELSEDAYQFANDGSGYESILSMWNAAEAIPWFLSDFSADAYQTIVGGMQQLTDRLCQRFLEQPGTEFHPSHFLHTLARDGDACTLAFTDHAGHPFREVRAKTVVLAMPQGALDRLQMRGLRFGEGDGDDATSQALFQWLLGGVTPKPLLKLFLIYDQPWWRDLNRHGSESFRVVTDQPLRQIYHFGPEYWPAASTGHETSHRLVLAYSDARFAEYWKQLNETDPGVGSRAGQRHGYVRSDFLRALSTDQQKALLRLLEDYGVSDRVVDRAQRQLARVHGVKPGTVPTPCVAFMKYWLDSPYFAGWHAWKPGIPSGRVARRLIKPFANADVYVCGEAFSRNQGWIEGALETADKVLARMTAPARA